jgi:hypothetical protein
MRDSSRFAPFPLAGYAGTVHALLLVLLSSFREIFAGISVSAILTRIDLAGQIQTRVMLWHHPFIAAFTSQQKTYHRKYAVTMSGLKWPISWLTMQRASWAV